MNYLFLTISLSALLTVSASAQTDTISKKRRFQAGVNFSSDYNYRILKKSYGDETTENIIQMRDTTESPKFGYTAGLNGCFWFNRHIGIELGAHYSNKGYQIKHLTVTTVNTPEGGDATAAIIFSYHYIDLPIKANFSFGDKKLQFIGSTGLVTHFFLKETDKCVIQYPDHKEEFHFKPDYDYDPVNLSAMLSAGVSYQLNNRMIVRVEPTVRYGLTNIIKHTPITASFYNAGVNVGYYISF